MEKGISYISVKIKAPVKGMRQKLPGGGFRAVTSGLALLEYDGQWYVVLVSIHCPKIIQRPI